MLLRTQTLIVITILTDRTNCHGNTTTHIEYFYDNYGPYGFSIDGTFYYYIKNLQGDVTQIRDTSNNLIASYVYDAWGKVLTVTENTTNGIGAKNAIRYRGYYYDAESNLYYLNARYYDPQIKRFVNEDEQNFLGADNSYISYNLYAYCSNNPIAMVDNTGHSGFLITLGVMAVGALIGAAVSAVSSVVTQKALTGEVNWKSVGVSAVTGFVSGAVAASPLGLAGQMIAGGIIGGSSYVADCYVNNRAMRLDEGLLSIGMGVVSGRIGGAGANEGKIITNTIESAKKTISKEIRRSVTNPSYAKKAISSAKFVKSSIISSAAINSSVRFAAGCGIANGVVTYYHKKSSNDKYEKYVEKISWKPW